MNPCTLGWYLPLLVQDKDVPDALLQPSDFAGKAPELRDSRRPVSSSTHSSVSVELRSGGHMEDNLGGSKRGGKGVQPSMGTAYQEAQVRGIGKAPSSAISAGGASGSGMYIATSGIRAADQSASDCDGDEKAIVLSTAAGKTPHAETNPWSQPNTAQSKTVSEKSSSPSHWEALDAQFRRGLPDSTYAGRLAYRGLVMRACPNIRVLDGVRTSEKERNKAEALLKRLLGEEDPDTTIRGVKLS